jgi:hypothetical protein
MYDKNGPLTPRQKNYLNQMGMEADDMADWTFSDANAEIKRRKTEHDQVINA